MLSPYRSGRHKYLYKGHIKDANVRVYKHCRNVLPVILFRRVTDKVLTVECAITNKDRPDVKLAAVDGSIVFERSFPKQKRLLVPGVQECARKTLCARGFMSKSARLHLVSKKEDAAALSHLAVLAKRGDTAHAKQNNRCVDGIVTE